MAQRNNTGSNWLSDLGGAILGTYRDVLIAENEAELRYQSQVEDGEPRAERQVNEEAAAAEDVSGPGSLNDNGDGNGMDGSQLIIWGLLAVGAWMIFGD